MSTDETDDDLIDEDARAVERFVAFADNLVRQAWSSQDVLEAVHWEIGASVVGTISVADVARLRRILADRNVAE